ncbi:MAG: hypothetical protein ACRDV0_02565, partial [Acidimicrobiales bacterium]
MLERWTRAVVRTRVVVVAFWAGVVVVGLVASSQLPSLLTTSLNVPGSASARANVILARDFHENVEGTFTVVVPTPHASRAQVAQLERAVANASRALAGARVTQERDAFGLLDVDVST